MGLYTTAMAQCHDPNEHDPNPWPWIVWLALSITAVFLALIFQ
jgi:hypothetical protein